MQFHDYRLLKQFDDGEIAASTSTREYYNRRSRHATDVCRLRHSSLGENEKAIIDVVLTECDYVMDNRPFYNVYPAVVKCLENTKFNFRLNQIKPLDECIAICFAVGHEPSADCLQSPVGRRVRSMILELREFNAMECDDSKIGSLVPSIGIRAAFDTDSNDGDESRGIIRFSGHRKTIEEVISDSTTELVPGVMLAESGKLVSIAIGVAMLAQDERFAEPILLKRDQGKQLDAEGLQRAIERAKRNGRNGMTIGRTLELSPHFRSPHFGIRWTGKGRTVPKLVPVKGCVVSRNKLYPIPTGYLDGEDY